MNENKRIAKNTIYLYIRTAITMLIALYTSRVILKQLGVSDYGVYNAIGGVVAMFSTLSGTLSGATCRYITFAIGKNDSGYLKKVFSASLLIHVALALIVIILAETLGLWYINNKLNIPDGRSIAAMFVYQASVISFAVDIVTLPFNSAIMAYERFGFYATVDIARACLKVALVSCLGLFRSDVLIVYCIMEFCLMLVYKGSYFAYVKSNFKDCSAGRVRDGSLYRELIGFTGWNFFGTASSVVYTQGSNLMLNYFWGVLLNAAMGVTSQVSNAVTAFVSNFTLAVNPQITKSYAVNDYGRTRDLIFLGSKIASYLLLIVGFPVVANLHYILNLWLVEVPEHTELFVHFALLAAFFGAFNNPFNCLMFATGNIKAYQISCVIINVMSVVGLYFCFAAHMNPVIIYILMIVQSFLKLAVMLALARKAISFPIGKFLFSVYGKSMCLLAVILGFLLFKQQVHYEMNFLLFIGESFLCVIIMALLIYALGLKTSEREYVREIICNKLHIKTSYAE